MSEPQVFATPNVGLASYLATQGLQPDEVVPAANGKADFRFARNARLTELLLAWASGSLQPHQNDLAHHRKVLLARATLAVESARTGR